MTSEREEDTLTNEAQASETRRTPTEALPSTETSLGSPTQSTLQGSQLLDGVTSDGHSVGADGRLVAAEPSASAGHGKNPSKGKEFAARFLVRTMQIYAIWQLVALVLQFFAPNFVERVSRILNLTNIPAYPTLLSLLLLTFISLGLLRRQRAALWLSTALWQVSVLVLMTVAAINFIMKPEVREYYESQRWYFLLAVIVALFAIVMAIWMRSAFPARVAPGALRRACLVVVLGLAASAGFAFSVLEVAGFGRLPFRQSVNWSISVALGLPPDQRPFHSTIEGPYWVETASGLISVASLLLAFIVFLRAAPQNAQRDYDDELAVRRLLLTAGSSDSLGYFATRDDRQTIFSADGKAALSFRVIFGVCLAAGDPIGDRQSWPNAIEKWLEHARSYGWVPGVISASEEGARAYRSRGLRAIVLGDEAVIDVASFRLASPELRAVRKAIAGPTNAGYWVQVRRQADIPAEELAELAGTADLWRRGGPERGFSMASGRIGDARDGRTLIVTAHMESGQVCGLLSFVPWGRRDASLDLMRRSPQAMSGVTELMITQLIANADRFGITKISLNFAMFRESFARGERIGASPLEKLNRKVLVFASRWWQLHSLYQSNEKYLPQWRPRLLCYDSTAQLTQVLIAVGQAEGFVPELPQTFRRHSRAPQLDLPETAAKLAEAVRRQEEELFTPVVSERRLSEQQQIRRVKLKRLIDAGIDPYPVDVPRTLDMADVKENSGTVSVVGRVVRVRDHGGILFADLREGGAERQIMFTADRRDAGLDLWRKTVDPGDVVSITGTTCLSRSGELSIHVGSWKMAAKCLTPPPDKHRGLRDAEARVRQRHMDLALSPDARRRLLARSAAVRAIRGRLAEHGFVEVETPMLNRIHGGANARPFSTHINAYDLDLTLRIAPELYLKRLCVGGFEKVFEIGKNFRNEGADSTHNPEFTSLEAYAAHGDYTTMRELTEDLLRTAAWAVHGRAIAPTPDGGSISLDGDWPVVSVHEAVSRAVGADVTPDTPLDELQLLCRTHGIHYGASMGAGDLVTELYEELVEGNTGAPTFYTDFPVETSPLTRRHRKDPRLAERWDLVAFGMELGTAYTELTDPIDQRQRLTEQSLRAAAGDPEAMEVDEEFLSALEFGMPPTGGLGLGIDRIAMFLLGASIRETLAFPFVRPDTRGVR